MTALTCDELLGFCTTENQRWQEWFAANPAALNLPIDIATAKSVRELVLHIVAVELRYAERLLDEKKITEYTELPTATVDELFSTSKRAAEMLRRFNGKADDAEWKKVISFPTRSAGTLSASKRKIFVHALLHGMRHWAQLATILRQQGYKTWQHDFLFAEVMA